MLLVGLPDAVKKRNLIKYKAMKLKDLSVGQRFKFANGNGKEWKKISNNGDVCEYNYCRCIDDLLPAQRRGSMLISGSNDHRMDKYADVVIV